MSQGLGHDRDESLMVEVAQGSPESLEILIRRYGTLLLSFIFSMVRDRQRSEDLFQDVFLIVWKKRRQYHFPRPFKPWLYRIAINRVRQVLRRRRERWLLLMEDDSGMADPPAADASPTESAIAVESSTLVRQAVALLPARQKLVVTMRIWNGFSYAEIAAAMGVREATARSNMHDALITIRRHLEPRM